MKKNIFIAMLLALVFSIHHAFAQEVSNKADDFKVRLPDGLYLYQPKIKEEVFSPLFIVEKGSLADPYALAAGIGKEKFIRDYVEGKRFHVYIEGVPVGILNDLRFEFVKVCYSDVLQTDIRGKGRYKGKPLREAYSNRSLYVPDEHERSYGSLKAVAAPLELKPDKTSTALDVTEKDKTMAIEAVRKRFVPEAFERVKERLETLHEEKQVITGDKTSRLNSLTVFDLDRNGKKDLIGIYDYTLSHRDAARKNNRDSFFPSEVLFVFFNGGSMEQVASAEGYAPAYSLGGLIDVDESGIPELILQESVTSGEYEDSDDGRRITILGRASSGWKEVYRSKKICGGIY